MKSAIILVIISTSVFGQDVRNFTRYFQNMTSEKTENQRRYIFNDQNVVIEDYNKDSLVTRGDIHGLSEIEQINEFAWYAISRGVEFNYRDYFHKTKGYFDFFEKGRIKGQIVIHGRIVKYAQVWNNDDVQILTNGTGQNTYRYDKENEEVVEVYEDSLLIAKYGIRNVKNDTIYYTSHKQASPKEGLQSFYQKLATTLNYPGIARLAGKEGRVYVQFIVDKDGSLTEFMPLTKEGFNFESKAIKKLSRFPNWNPAVYNNKYVKTKFVLPIKFQLTD